MAYIHVETKEKVYAKVYRVAHKTVTGNFTINIKNTYPTVDYTSLTNDDFICTYVGDGNHNGSDQSTYPDTGTYYNQVNSFSISPTYNASTGVLTVKPSTTNSSNYKDVYGTGSVSFNGLVCDVFMIVDGVREDYVK